MQSDLFNKAKPKPVPTLQVRQPFAEFLFTGHKQRIFTTAFLTSPLAIYAPRFHVQSIESLLCHKPHFKPLIGKPLEELDSGCLLGLVDVVSFERVPFRSAASVFWQNLPDEEIDRTDQIAPKMFCYKIANPRRLSFARPYSVQREYSLADPRIFEELL